MKASIKVCVFASGTGSNFQAIMETESLACEIVLLVCDRPGAPVIDKAKQKQIPVHVFDPTSYPSKQAYEEELITILREREVTWIFLAGYMRIIGAHLLQAYYGRIVNIHPSLLPKFPGKDAIGQAYRAKVNKTGVTVHYIDEGIDTGPIIAQQEVKIYPTDSLKTLTNRIQKVEHQLYPKVINQLIQNEGSL
jgi:phosphoribosylglycinamide formyltransferase 1